MILEENFVERICSGEKRAVGRAITWIENGHPHSTELTRRLNPHLGNAYRVGLTGPPGAGKSTLVDALAREMRKQEVGVGVIAVDPSSPFSGGAILGDRVRMTRALEDPEVFVRSMASRGSLGGLARTAQEAADVLDAMGKEWVMLETVGVGQSELSIASACDVTVVIVVPEAGGMVQTLKAGLMEIADIFVVNKSDRPGANEMVRQLREVGAHLSKDGWTPPVLKTTALDSEGLPELLEQIQAHREWALEGDRLKVRRRKQMVGRITELIRVALEERLWLDKEIQALVEANAQLLHHGDLSLFEAALASWEKVREHLAQIDLKDKWRVHYETTI